MVPHVKTILCVNSGSSSLKFAVYQGETCLEEGQTDDVMPLLEKFPIEAIGHRVVHGGPKHTKPELITPKLIAELQKVVPLAPLHMPPALELIHKLKAADLPQIACFDTAFHMAMPEIAKLFPLPLDLFDEGVRRYGFHGLSYEFIAKQVPKGRVVIAHLGNGASLAAIKDGAPMDTTMGLTPTGGLMMGTRSGDLDPGVVLYLVRRYGEEKAEDILNHKSGLKGISKRSSNMEALIQDKEIAAIDLFCYTAKKHLGAMIAVLGGIDTLVFTGGIGEHAPLIRDSISAGMTCNIEVMPTNEDLIIANHVREII
ncbi:MAG: Acetate kinase [Chlamydiia bacterium]|nr:Acetate kinase [Chlamydiia bacterium]MCH9615707.1 Acetate kinase [Chlamydiia bacterium]MCH9628890.1 Acetate kinase [Chlamydiia bacterium]